MEDQAARFFEKKFTTLAIRQRDLFDQRRIVRDDWSDG